MKRNVAVVVLWSALVMGCDKPAATPAPTARTGSGSGSAVTGRGSASGSGSGVAAGGSGSGSAVAVVAAVDDTAKSDFDKLDHDGQVELMKTKLMPAMKVAFKDFDAEFAKFNCKSCHGKDADARKFEMPNPGLPKLNFAELEATTDADQQRVLEFMTKVTHETAKILGATERSDATPDGFGCLDCHVETKE